MSLPAAAAGRFVLGGPAGLVEPWGGGHIHATWRVNAGGRRWILQRFNTAVFPDPDAVMANLLVLAERVATVVPPVRTHEGGVLWRDEGGVWRAFPFLEGTSPARPRRSAAAAAELGEAFGAFHRSTAALDPARLVEVLPGFHDPARRLRALEVAAAADDAGRRGGCGPELDAIDGLRWLAGLAAQLRAPEVVPLRVAHFDAKADNVLVDDATGAVRAIVDLDTAMPGTWLWDVGDLARSSTCPVTEDAPEWQDAVVDLDTWAALAGGYLSVAGPLLTAEERHALADSPLVVTFEQAVRFLTDHLAGDRYYRVARPGHNLDRARVQLALVRSMIERRSAMIAAL